MKRYLCAEQAVGSNNNIDTAVFESISNVFLFNWGKLWLIPQY